MPEGRGQEKGEERNKSDFFRTFLGAGGAGPGKMKRKEKFGIFPNYPGCRRGGASKKEKEETIRISSLLFWVPAGRGQCLFRRLRAKLSTEGYRFFAQ